MKRHRGAFPCHLNFNGWWIKSRKGIIAQLIRMGRNLHEHVTYNLLFKNGQVGNKIWTMEDLIEAGVLIRLNKEDLNNGKQDPAHLPIPQRPSITY